MRQYPDSGFSGSGLVAASAACEIGCYYFSKGDVNSAKKAFDLAKQKYPDPSSSEDRPLIEYYEYFISQVDAAVGDAKSPDVKENRPYQGVRTAVGK